MRYTWAINGKRIAEKQIPAEFNLLGVFAHWNWAPESVPVV
jgi:hypothetical protein